MAKVGRDPVKDGLLQTNLDGGGFIISNVAGVGNIQSATLYVDPTLTTEFGVRATGLPFMTISAAVAAAQPGDTIILRPGVHAYDGVIDIFHLDDLTIVGKGAIITSVAEANEVTKITVRSNGVTIYGIEFDGAVDIGGALDANVGCIDITDAADVTIRDCWIHLQAGSGIVAHGRVGGLKILGTNIDNCGAGFLTDTTGVTANVLGLTVEDCEITFNRIKGISVVGPTVVSGFSIQRIRIANNKLFDNSDDVTTSGALVVSFGCKDVIVIGNHVTREYNGIVIHNSLNVIVSGNNLSSITNVGFGIQGCQGLTLIGNVLDGRSSAGNSITNKPCELIDFYSVPNDAGPYLIEGNQFHDLKIASFAITVANANSVTINGNRLSNALTITASTYVMVNGNTITTSQTTQAILVDACAIGWSHCTINGNRFRSTGASLARVIATVDASATGGNDLVISNNVCDPGFTYTTATYSHSGSNAPTNVVKLRNTPVSTTGSAANGWINNDDPNSLKQVFVSQMYGVNATGVRQSYLFPFLTISAAITAASSGDTVVVLDGTFNEQISAKDGITVRFEPAASLVCSTANGCIKSTAASEIFTVYHTHKPITCTKNATSAVLLTHTGTYEIHADIVTTGNSVSHGLNMQAACSVFMYGSIICSFGNALSSTGGLPFVTMVPVLNGRQNVVGANLWSAGSLAVALDGGGLIIDGFTILGGGAHAATLQAGNTTYDFARCKFIATGTAASAVFIQAGANKPVFRDCVLISESTATGSITVSGAQSIKVYGTVIANKGADPPASVTVLCGIYDVDSDVS